MISETQLREIAGTTAYTHDGEKLGRVGQVFVDDATGEPEFVTVNTGLFGTSESFVPIAEAAFDGNQLTVPYTKDKVKDAPNVNGDSDGHITPEEETRLFEYYGLGSTGTGPESSVGTGPESSVGTASGTQSPGQESLTGSPTESGAPTGGEVAPAGNDASGPNTDDAMTRSEERLDVGTAPQEAGRVRLRKYVTTEQETHTVPVRKEHAVLETEPITEGNVGQAVDGPEISDEEHEVVLHEERPVVERTTEPVERVRLGKETSVDEQTVSDEVRKEQVEVEGDAERR